MQPARSIGGRQLTPAAQADGPTAAAPVSNVAPSPRGDRGRVATVLAILAACLAATLLAPRTGLAQSGGSFVLRAGRVITSDPRQPAVIEGGVIVVRDGVIVAVGKDLALPPDLRVIDLPQSTVMPGLVAASSVPATSGGPESVRAAYRAADAFDRYGDYRETLASGVTTMHLSPGWNRLVSGRGSVVRLGGPADQRVLKEDADLTITLGEGMYNPPLILEELVPPSSDNAITPSRPQRPSSRLGQFLALKESIERATAPGAAGRFDDHSAALGAAWKANLPIRIQTQRSADIAGAVAFLAQQKKSGYLVGGAEAAALADQLAQAGVPLVYTLPGSFTAPGRNIGNDPAALDPSATDLARLDRLKLAIATGPFQPVSDLRLAAAVARQSGLSSQRLIEAITRVPAELLGVADRVGSLEAGKRADLLVLTGDPLTPSTQVQKVYIDGRVVFSPSMRDTVAQGARAAEPSGPGPLVVRAGTIWLGPSEWMERGEILIENGKITAIGKRVATPQGARIIDAGPESFVTPGFIDAYGHLGLDGDLTPPGPEFSLARLVGVPDVSDLRVARSGVTTVMTAPYRSSGLGSQMAAIKTAGATRAQRVVSPTAAVVFELGDADPITIGDRLKPRLEAGKKYLATWQNYEKELGEWEKKRASGQVDVGAKPKVVDEGPAGPKQDDPLTGSWRARLFGGPIPPQDEREGTIAFKLTGNQFEGRVTEPPIPVEFKVTGTLDGKKMSGKLEIESRGLGYPTFEGTIDREDHATGTISFQGLVVNFEMRRVDKSEVEFKVQATRKRKTTGKDGRPLPPKTDDGLEPMRLVLEKKIPVVVSCTSPGQIDAVLDVLVDQYDVPVVLLGADGARVYSARLSEKNVAVIPPPRVMRKEKWEWYGQLDDLSRHGVRVAMQSDAEDGARTLPSVALYAVQQGLSPEAALAALTVDAARSYRLEGRLGTIAAGKEGDLVIFSGYPFDAGSTIKAVIVGGEEVAR